LTAVLDLVLPAMGAGEGLIGIQPRTLPSTAFTWYFTTWALELGQYTNISIYHNTDNRNIISIHPITVLIYRNIDISQYIGLFYAVLLGRNIVPDSQV